MTGRSYGALASCGANGNFPLTGSFVADSGNVVLGFLVSAVAVGCGSIEVKVVIDPPSLTGTLELYNAKNLFSNSGPVTITSCPAGASSLSKNLPVATRDAQSIKVSSTSSTGASAPTSASRISSPSSPVSSPSTHHTGPVD